MRGFPLEINLEEGENDAEGLNEDVDENVLDEAENGSGYVPTTPPKSDQGSDREQPVKRLLFQHESRGHWPYDCGCDACVQARSRTPARRCRKNGDDDQRTAIQLAAYIHRRKTLETFDFAHVAHTDDGNCCYDR